MLHRCKRVMLVLYRTEYLHIVVLLYEKYAQDSEDNRLANLLG